MAIFLIDTSVDSIAMKICHSCEKNYIISLTVKFLNHFYSVIFLIG